MKPPRCVSISDLVRIFGAAGIIQGIGNEQIKSTKCQQYTRRKESGLSVSKCATKDADADRTLCKRPTTERVSPLTASVVLAQSPYAAPSPTTKQKCESNSSDKAHIERYDFVVVGNGLAGQAAVQELIRQCPNATIAVIDPLYNVQSAMRSKSQQEESNRSNVKYHAKAANFLNPRQRTIRLAATADGEDECLISYRHAVLLATGARGAPIPHYIYDETAKSRILTLRMRTLTPNDEKSTSALMLPEQIMHHALQSASRGQRIAILGSGWDAVALALQVGAASLRNKRPMLIMGASGPLSHVLPNYLVTAVSKRLKSKHVYVKDRTLIRYISEAAQDESNGKQQPQLQIYTAKSFDFLDSRVDAADWVVAAPDATGPRGSASLGSGLIPDHLNATINGRSWYQSWSDMTVSSETDPMSLACYQEDGRIAVNAELCACTGVFAAGSVAKLPNSFTGHADVAGEGADDAINAGRVAAHNMALHHQAYGNQSTSTLFRTSNSLVAPATKDPTPVFRTDNVLNGTDSRSILSENGINALMVGHCDAERFTTIGVWWTNQATQRRVLAETDDAQQPTLRHRKSIPDSLKSVYGLGIVYYFDRNGHVRGITTWGLPVATKDSSSSDLVEEMKHMIRTNGGFQSVGSDVEQMRMIHYLTESSRKLVSSCLSSSRPSNGRIADDNERLQLAADLPKPLIRFTQSRRNSIRTGLLKRKEGHSFGVLGEDLFARYQQATHEVSLTKPDMNLNVGYAAQQAQDRYDWSVWEQKEMQWEENEAIARPPREDPLWIRKGDEVRQTSAKDNLLAAFNKALWGHSG
ncbi:hypothetical protein MPSEU_000648500 [Mayamaea pseudoterrestris]|nr:hypothetical protein MPSEU_000648500 [Mayamaea pseudoterrestris]